VNWVFFFLLGISSAVFSSECPQILQDILGGRVGGRLASVYQNTTDVPVQFSLGQGFLFQTTPGRASTGTPRVGYHSMAYLDRIPLWLGEVGRLPHAGFPVRSAFSENGNRVLIFDSAKEAASLSVIDLDSPLRRQKVHSGSESNASQRCAPTWFALNANGSLSLVLTQCPTAYIYETRSLNEPARLVSEIPLPGPGRQLVVRNGFAYFLAGESTTVLYALALPEAGRGSPEIVARLSLGQCHRFEWDLVAVGPDGKRIALKRASIPHQLFIWEGLVEASLPHTVEAPFPVMSAFLSDSQVLFTTLGEKKGSADFKAWTYTFADQKLKPRLAYLDTQYQAPHHMAQPILGKQGSWLFATVESPLAAGPSEDILDVFYFSESGTTRKIASHPILPHTKDLVMSLDGLWYAAFNPTSRNSPYSTSTVYRLRRSKP
jgi:hypothetical protein